MVVWEWVGGENEKGVRDEAYGSGTREFFVDCVSDSN